MKPWGALPGYPTADGCWVGQLPEYDLGPCAVTSVRLPEPHLAYDEKWSDVWGCAWYAGQSFGESLTNASREISRFRALYFAARLTGLDDEQAARQAWSRWRGEE